MAYTLTINNIYPISVEQKSGVAFSVDFTLSGSGFVIPGCNISLYDSLTGGTFVKTLFYDDMYDLTSGNAVSVSFSDVSPGNYYVQVFYKAIGAPRRLIQVIGSGGGIRNITLDGTKVTSNNLNGVAITNETLNGTKVYD